VQEGCYSLGVAEALKGISLEGCTPGGARKRVFFISPSLTLVWGSEDYKIAVQFEGSATESLNRDRQIGRAESNIMGYHSSPQFQTASLLFFLFFAKYVI